MTFILRTIGAATVLMTAIFASACSQTKECPYKGTTGVVLRADQMCPSAHDFQARVDSEEPKTGESIDSEPRVRVSIQARVVCWYRSTEAEGIKPCFFGTRASMLAVATGPEQLPNEGTATSSTSYLMSCDAEGTLYGQIILVAEADASTGLPATPVDCPDKVTPDPSAADKLTAVTTFVGSDEYPARVACDYDMSGTSWCGWGDFPTPS